MLLPSSLPSSGSASLWRGTGVLPQGSWHRQYSALPLLRSRTNSDRSSCEQADAERPRSAVLRF